MAVTLKFAVLPAHTVRLDKPETTMFVGGRQITVETALNNATSCAEFVVK